MSDNHNADVDRALASFGGTTMKYLNFASPLLKRAGRTPTPAAAERSYEPLFRRAASLAPEVAPATTMNDDVVFASEKPAVDRGPLPPAASTAEIEFAVKPEAVLLEAAAIAAAHTRAAIAPVQSEPPPRMQRADAAAAADVGGPAIAADRGPSISLADHMLRLFLDVPRDGSANAAARPNHTAEQAATPPPDRRTVAEMFRILSGPEERHELAVGAAHWRNTEQSFFRRL